MFNFNNANRFSAVVLFTTLVALAALTLAALALPALAQAQEAPAAGPSRTINSALADGVKESGDNATITLAAPAASPQAMVLLNTPSTWTAPGPPSA